MVCLILIFLLFTVLFCLRVHSTEVYVVFLRMLYYLIVKKYGKIYPKNCKIFLLRVKKIKSCRSKLKKQKKLRRKFSQEACIISVLGKESLINIPQNFNFILFAYPVVSVENNFDLFFSSAKEKIELNDLYVVNFASPLSF